MGDVVGEDGIRVRFVAATSLLEEGHGILGGILVEPSQ